MLWGKGDTSRLDEGEVGTLTQLRRMVETGHIVALTPDQSATLIRALDWYSGWESAFRVMGNLRNTIIMATFFLGVWWTTEGHIIDFIIGAKE